MAHAIDKRCYIGSIKHFELYGSCERKIAFVARCMPALLGKNTSPMIGRDGESVLTLVGGIDVLVQLLRDGTFPIRREAAFGVANLVAGDCQTASEQQLQCLSVCTFSRAELHLQQHLQALQAPLTGK